MKKLNLVNQKFGKLLVLDYAYSKNNRSYWYCICDCGNEIIKRGKELQNGIVKSCGCLIEERRIDLTNKKFNKLTVIECCSRDLNGRFYWLCKCACGNTIIARGDNLRNNSTQSCGCYRDQRVSETHKNKIVSNETKAKRSGKNNCNYNPLLSKEERIIKRTYPKYIEWRSNIFEKDSYTCQKCGNSRGGNLNAHHIESYADNPRLRTESSNGITLCKNCHNDFHHQYGYGNNNIKQINKFLNRKK